MASEAGSFLKSLRHHDLCLIWILLENENKSGANAVIQNARGKTVSMLLADCNVEVT